MLVSGISFPPGPGLCELLRAPTLHAGCCHHSSTKLAVVFVMVQIRGPPLSHRYSPCGVLAPFQSHDPLSRNHRFLVVANQGAFDLGLDSRALVFCYMFVAFAWTLSRLQINGHAALLKIMFVVGSTVYTRIIPFGADIKHCVALQTTINGVSWVFCKYCPHLAA